MWKIALVQQGQSFLCSTHLTRKLAVLTLAAMFLAQAGYSAVVEVFPAAYAPPAFGKLPWIQGSLVVWKSNSSPGTRMDVIQCTDISRIGGPVLDIAPYDFAATGVLLSRDFLFRGAIDRIEEDSPLIARPVRDLKIGVEADIIVNGFGQAVGSTSEYVIIRVDFHEEERFNRKYFAKSRSELGVSSLESLNLVASFKERTEVYRPDAVSEMYLVWQDRDPGRTETWKVYAKRTENLLAAGAEFLAVDTNILLQRSTHKGGGVEMDLEGSLLVVQAAEHAGEDAPVGLLLLNLDAPAERRFLTLRYPEEGGVGFYWPAISTEYVVWMRAFEFFTRSAWAQRLVEGRPEGEPFEIGPGGTEIALDRNIAVWKGAIRLEGEQTDRAAIMAAELDLPGAQDVGDVNQDGIIDLTDAVSILQYLFVGGWRPRLRLADADLSRRIDITDAVRILEFLFLGERRPGA